MPKSKKRPTQKEEVSIIDHLDDLRKRILISVAFVFIFSIIAYMKSDWIIYALKQPLGNVNLVFLTPVEGFMTKLKVAFFGGTLLASPFIFLQTMLFISPILEKGERILLFISLPFIVSLFLGGAFFCFYFIMPQTLHFLMGFGDQNMQPMLSANKYYSFVMMFTMAMGLIFELPLIMLVLSRFGVINHKKLSKNRKYYFFLIVVITALVTPTPDAFTLLAVAVPLGLLFEISLGAVYLYDKLLSRRRKTEEDLEESKES